MVPCFKGKIKLWIFLLLCPRCVEISRLFCISEYALMSLFWNAAIHRHTWVYQYEENHSGYKETNSLWAPLKVAAAFKHVYSCEFEWSKSWLLRGDFLNISRSFWVSNGYDLAFPWLFIPQQLRCVIFPHFPRKCYDLSSWSSPSWTVTFPCVSISAQLLLGFYKLILLSCCC